MSEPYLSFTHAEIILPGKIGRIKQKQFPPLWCGTDCFIRVNELKKKEE